MVKSPRKPKAAGGAAAKGGAGGAIAKKAGGTNGFPKPLPGPGKAPGVKPKAGAIKG